MTTCVFKLMNLLYLCLLCIPMFVTTEAIAEYVGTNTTSGSIFSELPATFDSYETLLEFSKQQHVGTQLTNITCKGTSLWVLIRNVSGGETFEEISVHSWATKNRFAFNPNRYERILLIPFQPTYFSVEKTEQDTVRIFEHMGSSSNRRIVFEIHNVVGSKWYRDDFIKDMLLRHRLSGFDWTKIFL